MSLNSTDLKIHPGGSVIKILRKHTFVVIVSMLALFLANKVAAQPREAFFFEGDLNAAAFDREVKKMMSDLGVPGLSLAVILNNRIVYHQSYGVREMGRADEVNDETVFIGCSLSKSFLVFVAHQLVDEDRMDLDRPLYLYREYELLAHDPRYKLITARMVLSHSSGIENMMPDYDDTKLDIVADPGERYIYSGEGYHYLAAVIEEITGHSYEEYIRDRVIRPLKLGNTYLKFQQTPGDSAHSERPWNYAVGHLALGQTNVIKNEWTAPAFGNHFIAEDYAKLFLATFDTAHLSLSRINDLVMPVVEVDANGGFYGPGYELFIDDHDVIVSQAGSCEGYKHHVFYSLLEKKGVVFMSNSDLGDMMASRLCRYAVGVEIASQVESSVGLSEQYPHSYVPALLRLYKKSGREAMFQRIDKLEGENKLSPNSLNLLGILMNGVEDNQILKSLFRENMMLNGREALSYSLLGNSYLESRMLDSALYYFNKAKERGDHYGTIDASIAECKRRMAEAEKRKMNCSQVHARESAVIQAEDYNAMEGGHVYGYCIGGFRPGDWMTYRLNVDEGGLYSVTFSVASLTGGGEYQVWTDDKLLATVVVPPTGGWEGWSPVTIEAPVAAGGQTMKLYTVASGFNIDQIVFKKK